nr:hypothetical protein [uncultured Draconibacterium sp.]
MKKLSLALIIVLGVSLSFNAAGQEVRASERIINRQEAKHDLNIEIDAHALVGLSSHQAINLKPVAPTQAGEGLDFSEASDESIYLQYSSIKASKDKKITVSLKEPLPGGVAVQLKAGSARGGKGILGSSDNSKLTLTDENDQDLITGIGSCYTGTKATNGHKLKYTLIVDDASYGDIVAKNYSNEVIYTITED